MSFTCITCTKAELEEQAVLWRWFRWCEMWSHIGAYAHDLDRRERALFEWSAS